MSMSSWFTGKSGVVAASAVTSPVSYASIEDAQESVNKLIGVGMLTFNFITSIMLVVPLSYVI